VEQNPLIPEFSFNAQSIESEKKSKKKYCILFLDGWQDYQLLTIILQ